MALDPKRGIFRWARSRARSHRTRFGVGSVLLAAVAIVGTAGLHSPSHPTLAQRAVNGLLGLGIAVLAILILTFAYAVLVAPYEQRNMLRRMLAESEDALATMQSERDAASKERDDAVKERDAARLRADFSAEHLQLGDHEQAREVHYRADRFAGPIITHTEIGVTGAAPEPERFPYPVEPTATGRSLGPEAPTTGLVPRRRKDRKRQRP